MSGTDEQIDDIGDLGESQLELLSHWVRLADDLGVPRSLSQLYGLLFLSEKPLSAQDCADRLQISRSSAGQGLRSLKELGAIKPSFKLGERSEQFVVEPDLGVMICRVLDGRLVPAFSAFFDAVRVQSKRAVTDFDQSRFSKLERWESKLRKSIKTFMSELQ